MGGENFSVSEIFPPISPNLIIEPSLDVSGFAACNNYMGNFSYDSTNDLLTLNNFDATLNLCDYQTHIDFETSYFSFLLSTTFSYSIIYDINDDEYLDLVSPSGSIFHYQNTPNIFSINDEVFSKTYTYPNPVSNTLFISSENSQIESITVYSVFGKMFLKQNNNQNNSLDVSNLSKGIYFIEIYSENGKSIQKFIKK